MTVRPAIVAVSLIVLSWADAQKVIQEPQEDPVQAAIREFNRRDSKKPNEVSVVLDPTGDAPAPVKEKKKSEPATDKPADKPKEKPADPSAEEAVLVTGMAPEDSELLTEETAPEDAVSPEPAAEEPAPPPRKGLNVRVEKLQTGTGQIDPAEVKLLAPFPAKPLSTAPAGWRLETSESAPPLTREIELSAGGKITLKVHPHLLVPEADGTGVFNVREPGFNPALGYRQDSTVGAILSNSIRQLDSDSKTLGAAIDNLQQLLVSLPKPEPEPQPEAPSKPATSRK
jgi:hypothetical protein